MTQTLLKANRTISIQKIIKVNQPVVRLIKREKDAEHPCITGDVPYRR